MYVQRAIPMSQLRRRLCRRPRQSRPLYLSALRRAGRPRPGGSGPGNGVYLVHQSPCTGWAALFFFSVGGSGERGRAGVGCDVAYKTVLQVSQSAALELTEKSAWKLNKTPREIAVDLRPAICKVRYMLPALDANTTA